MIQAQAIQCPSCSRKIAEVNGPMTTVREGGSASTFATGLITCRCGTIVEMERGQVKGFTLPKREPRLYQEGCENANAS